MFRWPIREFLKDEQGSYTIWGLVWFMLYVGIGGLAVDITDAYRNQSLLQATADSSALAAIMSVGVSDEDPTAEANQYAAINMAEGHNGDVLADTDITVGTWNFAGEFFTAGGTDPNAVYVVTRRADQNANPVATNFLRIIGLGRWNVVAEAVAVKGVDACLNNGMIAGRELDIKTHTRFWRNICLIGNQGMLHRDNGNLFESGVYAGVGCEGGCVGPNENVAFRNEEFMDAFDLDIGGNYSDPTRPENAYIVGDYMNAVLNMANYANFDAFTAAYNAVGVDYSGYKYLTDPGTGKVKYENVSTLPAKVTTDAGKFTVYKVNCSGNLDLPNGTYRNLAIIASCRLKLGGEYNMSNVLLASTHSGGGQAVHASGKTDLGAPNCGEGGVEIYAMGDINIASSGNITNTRILSAGNVHMAANGQGPIGIHIEAAGDIFAASGSSGGSDFGLCPNSSMNGAHVLTYSLVH